MQVERLIGAIGEPDFAATAAACVLDFMRFELSAVVVHRPRSRPQLVFDNFDIAGAREGIANYLEATHRANPMLAQASRCAGAFRARDFAGRAPVRRADERLVDEPDEEMGYRTVGWPARLEEIGLYFPVRGGLVELGVYRERTRRPVEADRLDALAAWQAPIAAAFDKHAMLTGALPMALSPREAEVARLLLLGCGSEAIALRLGLSRHTVKGHRKQIFRKLGVSSLAELFALQRPPPSRVGWS